MNKEESSVILGSMIVLFGITAFSYAISGDMGGIIKSGVFSILLILVVVGSKKLAANMLDSNVEHSIWKVSHYGFKPHEHFEKEIPAGIFAPLFFSLITLGALIVPTFMTFEVTALKRRAARRFGYYSYSEMTDWHIALIGAAGMIGVLLFSILLYFLPFNMEKFAVISAIYAFFNMIPLSKLDGAQIFFGSRVLWAVVAVIVCVVTMYASLIAFSTI